MYYIIVRLLKIQKTGHYGQVAVLSCYEKPNGELWVGNDEYENEVSYCPFCGFKSPKLVETQTEIKS